ncbi:MAG: hypothetical protein HPY74_19575 [Firmicutes bacterium]|nr:hypothetical protein [Bacillota bacterium]
MQNRKQRQREKRKEKRCMKHQLKIQAENNKNDTSIGIYKKLDRSFFNYAINKTKLELRNGEIGQEREVLLKKVIKLKNKLNPKERSVS